MQPIIQSDTENILNASTAGTKIMLSFPIEHIIKHQKIQSHIHIVTAWKQNDELWQILVQAKPRR